MYLMKFRFGPVDELLDIWKSACGFEMDTYNLEERILSLLMFNWDYRSEGADILKAYIRHSGKECDRCVSDSDVLRNVCKRNAGDAGT